MRETISPYKSDSDSKKSQVARMFNNIALRYDFLNHFLSLGIDRYWRKVAINQLSKNQPKLILDIATGTADFAIASLKINPEKIFGVDISVEMLEIGKKKIKKKNLDQRIELLEGDAEHLIFDDNKFDAATVAFGVRNFENLEKGLTEILRVIKPGGKVIILEFSHPKNRLMNGLYQFYSTKVTPIIGKLVSGDQSAYTYLHESIEAFPSGDDFLSILAKSGFHDTSARPLTFGIVSIYSGTKQ